jgi:nucleoporin NUP2
VFGSTNPFGNSAKSDSPFSPFGSGKITFGAGSAGTTSASTNAFSGFGKPSGVIGNPVGFGFGGQTPTPNSEPSPNASEEKPSETPPEESEAAKAVFATTHNDEDGQGEEEEETIHQVRAKVYKLVKEEGGPRKWECMGIGRHYNSRLSKRNC